LVPNQDFQQAKPRAFLVRLEHQIGLPSRPLWRFVLDERLLFATLLIVALSLVAALQAPPQRFVASPAAMP
jgi:hypothetical protein